MPALKLLFIGESLVMAGAIEIARSRGHDILGVLAAVPGEAEMFARLGLDLADRDGDVDGFVAGHDCDVLFSIINQHILKPATLARPHLASINYHNAPLPAYAGLFATSWAVLDGAAEHGATWHVMEPGIDTGAILAQRRFALSPDETTASLNARCTTAALECLPDVFAMLERGEIAGEAQDLSRRSYHNRHDTAPNDGLIDWRWPAEKIGRLTRACDWGTSRNDFGRACFIAQDSERVVVRRADAVAGSGAPGTILGRDAEAIIVACGDGAVRLSLDQSHGIMAGAILSVADRADEPEARDHPGQATARPQAATVVELIAAQALADPAAPVIDVAGKTLSRGELVATSRRIAASLIATGLAPGDGVGILMPAGANFVAAALGAMLAGFAYVPLDPGSPRARHLVEIAEAGIACVLTDDRSAAPTGLPGVAMIELADLPSAATDCAFAAVATESCAYRIFTSGSTGRPKAVEISHAALANLIAHYRAALPMNPSDRMTMLTHPSFDASVADIWPILAAGGTLLVPPAGLLRDPSGLIDWLAQSRASCTFVPTAIAERLLRLDWPKSSTLRVLLTGGDTLHMRPPARLPFRLINTYGPTENTVDSLWAIVAPGEGRPTIGRPIAGVTAAIIDHAGNPAIDGQIGELVLGGAQVAQGYRGRADLTAAAFQGDPDHPGARRYHTGDRARLNAQGDYEFHGRGDDQVQLRGIRVELGEIEALLKSHQGVAEAACVPIRLGHEIVGLAAYVVASADVAGGAGLRDDLQHALERQLPSAIVPSRIDIIASLPRTTGGKIDRNALAEPDRAETAAVDDGDRLRVAWHRLLPAAAETAEDTSFWDLGGDSLTAIELLMAIERDIGVRLPISRFLADPSLAGIRRSIASRGDATVFRLSEGAGPPIALWYGVSGDLEAYQNLARHLGDREVICITSPALTDHSRIPPSLEEAVALGLAALRRFGIFEPPAMIGFSWSGLLAFEAARQLAEAGTPSPFVAILAGLPPFTRRGRTSRILRMLRRVPTVIRAIATGRQRRERLAAYLGHARQFLTRNGDLPEMPEWATRPLHQLHLDMARQYQPSPGAPVTLCLYRDRSVQRSPDYRGFVAFEDDDLGWSRWAGAAVEVRWIEADHNELVSGASAAQLADDLGRALDAVADDEG